MRFLISQSEMFQTQGSHFSMKYLYFSDYDQIPRLGGSSSPTSDMCSQEYQVYVHEEEKEECSQDTAKVIMWVEEGYRILVVYIFYLVISFTLSEGIRVKKVT